MQHQLSIQYPQHWLDALQLTQKSFQKMCSAFNKYLTKIMKTVTLKIDDSIVDRFLWLLKYFANEIKILDQSDYVSDDEYLRSIDGMVQSIQNARKEPDCNGVTLDKLDW